MPGAVGEGESGQMHEFSILAGTWSGWREVQPPVPTVWATDKEGSPDRIEKIIRKL
jgi:hypothetical protein